MMLGAGQVHATSQHGFVVSAALAIAPLGCASDAIDEDHAADDSANEPSAVAQSSREDRALAGSLAAWPM
jgi:hypothetical protein